MRAAAFTLLEMMLAVAILAIFGVAVYRFTSLNVEVARLNSGEAERQAMCAGLTRLLQTQLDELPAREAQALRGTRGRRSDDRLTLLCLPGNGLLARDGAPRLCTLHLRPETHELGLTRAATSPKDEADLPNLGGDDESDPGGDWTPLLSGVASLEITYFSARLNGWLPRWTDANALPDLVRVSLSFIDVGEDYETTLHVPLRGQTIVN
ncbi:MAG: prepilin-type N-terminal cleavage/methylation domain-containing protein, partial [Verrucomicrobia bacterium]|nr:prepilin-type N-terminal cleavage/methylation domain-containing protein [Verrucomicrobiota bacterium]